MLSRLFISAFIACIIVFPIYLISTAISRNPQRREARIERLKKLAIERGHVVTANFKKMQTFSIDRPGTIKRLGHINIYEYYYNGKRYKFRYLSDSSKPLTLYFVNNPRKATVDEALTDSKVSWPVIFLMVTVLVYLVNGI